MGPSAGGPSTSSQLSKKPLRTQKEIGGKRFRVSGFDQYTPARRRRQRRRRIGMATGVCLVVLAAGGWFGYQHVEGKGHDKATAAALCGKTLTTKHSSSGTPTATGATKPADPLRLARGDVTVNVYNATDRTGLAAITANELRSRGFKIGKVSNDPVKETVTATALVRGSAAGLARLQVIEAQVHGSMQVFDHRTNTTVDLVLGNGYQRLNSSAQVDAALRAATAADAKAAAKPSCH